MLTQVGIDVSDELGLPIGLYATTKRGYPLYLALGFTLYDEKEEDLAQYGWHGTYNTYHMIRGDPGPKSE